VDDLPVLEVDFGQRAADLGPQFDPVDRRENCPRKTDPWYRPSRRRGSLTVTIGAGVGKRRRLVFPWGAQGRDRPTAPQPGFATGPMAGRSPRPPARVAAPARQSGSLSSVE